MGRWIFAAAVVVAAAATGNMDELIDVAFFAVGIIAFLILLCGGGARGEEDPGDGSSP